MPENTPGNGRRPNGAGGTPPRPRLTPWIVIAGLAVTAMLAFNQFSSISNSNRVTNSEFQTAVQNGKIDPNTVVKISDSSVSGAILQDDGSTEPFTAKLSTNVSIDQQTAWTFLAQHSIAYEFDTPNPWGSGSSTACFHSCC